MPQHTEQQKCNGNGKNLLESLREKISADYIVEEIKDAEPLTASRLMMFGMNMPANWKHNPINIQLFKHLNLQSCKLKLIIFLQLQ